MSTLPSVPLCWFKIFQCSFSLLSPFFPPLFPALPALPSFLCPHHQSLPLSPLWGPLGAPADPAPLSSTPFLSLSPCSFCFSWVAFSDWSLHWKMAVSVFVFCVGGRGRPWENSSKVQKNVTSSSLNKWSPLHLFAQIFPLPLKKTPHPPPWLA